jgi:hypothetical protein
MWSNLKKALRGRFSLPDSDSLQGDLTGPGCKYRSDGALLLESKDEMKKRGMPSPDEGDAVALCFSEPAGSQFSTIAISIGKLNTITEAMSEPMTRHSVGRPLCHPSFLKAGRG